MADDFQPKPAGCKSCPMCDIGKGFAPGIGPKDAELAIIMEALGETEAKKGRPACGGAGNYLVALTRRAGLISTLTKEESEAEEGIPLRLLKKHSIYLDNILRCQPPKNKYPKGKIKKDAEACCRQYDPDLPNVKVVVAMGNRSFNYITGQKGGVTLWHGSVIPHHQGKLWQPPDQIWKPPAQLVSHSPKLKSTVPAVANVSSSSVYVVPTIHPAFLMRDPSDWPLVVHDLERAKKIVDAGGQWESPKQRLWLLDTVIAVKTVLHELSKKSKPDNACMCDIENTKAKKPDIECISFCLEPPDAYVLPVQRISGEHYWSDKDWPVVLQCIQNFFSSAYVGFQHGMHDVNIIEKTWGPVAHWVADLCYLHFCTYAELPHNLGAIQSAFTRFNAHKQMVKMGDVEEAK